MHRVHKVQAAHLALVLWDLQVRVEHKDHQDQVVQQERKVHKDQVALRAVEE